mmetsp:Transcript_96828/g.278609  ORF Transcript_96828/g.278609 Transcript_96828/m.278609 type:complete len:272 (-) Transcript_96828:158-973(-)
MRTPLAARASLRPFGSFPQCQSTRNAWRNTSTESAIVFMAGRRPSRGARARKPKIRSIKCTSKRSFMPPLAYIETAAKVCRRYIKHMVRGSVAGMSGKVAHKYCAMLRTVPWSTTCWQPSRKTVMACMAWATCIFTSSSLQLRRSLAKRGKVGPAATVPTNFFDIAVLPMGIKERPPMSKAMLPITRAASRLTGMSSCVKRLVAAATTSEAMAWHLFSWFELKSQIVRSASHNCAGAMPGVVSCSTRRGKRRSPKAMLTSSSLRCPLMSSR